MPVDFHPARISFLLTVSNIDMMIDMMKSKGEIVPTLLRASLAHARYYVSVLREASAYYQQGSEEIARSFALLESIWPNLVLGQKWAEHHWIDDADAACVSIDYAQAGTHILAVRQQARDRIHWLETGLAAAVRMDNSEALEYCTRAL